MELTVDDFSYQCLAAFATISVWIFYLYFEWVRQTTILYIIGFNVIVFFAYGIDKAAAYFNMRNCRIPENVLLLGGLIGGWIGAICGQQLFRHKTREQPFQTLFIVTIVLHTVLMAIYILSKQ